MGRGFSKLQRFILTKAATTADSLLRSEILAEFWGWKPISPIRSRDGKRTGLYHFSRKQIGEKRYASVMASLSRACRQLQERGLIEQLMGPSGNGLTITPKGRAWVISEIGDGAGAELITGRIDGAARPVD